VKGIHFEGLRVLGKPEEFARHYYEQGADELIYMDAVASLYGRNSLLDMVERTSREIFIPLTVGGGLRSLADIRGVLRAGADKVSINTAAIARPELIREASRAFGASTIVVSIEALAHAGGRYEAYVNYGRDATGVDAFEWAMRAAELGAGEIMVTSINREGTGKGFDIDLIRRIASGVPIPVIAGGGAGSPAHVSDVVAQAGVNGVAIASLLHYSSMRRVQEASHSESEGNVEFLRRGTASKRFDDVSIGTLKAHLTEQGIDCRYRENSMARAS
jgi:cyclase